MYIYTYIRIHIYIYIYIYIYVHFSPTAESFGVAGQIGSGVVGGGPEVRFHEGSSRVPRGFHEVLRGLREGRALKRALHAVGDIT